MFWRKLVGLMQKQVKAKHDQFCRSAPAKKSNKQSLNGFLKISECLLRSKIFVIPLYSKHILKLVLDIGHHDRSIVFILSVIVTVTVTPLKLQGASKTSSQAPSYASPKL